MAPGLCVPVKNLLKYAAALAFLLVSGTFFVLGQGERSAYVLTTSGMPGQSLFGYTFGLGDRPLMAENTYYFDQTLMFDGAGGRFTMWFYSIRPIYAFAASVVAPLTGVLGALQLVNYLAWVLAAVVAWRFTMARYRDEWAASLAVVLVAFGLRFAIHIHDYSPHMLPFAVYYLGILILYESRVWAEARPWLTHLRIGLFLALASLTYSTGIILTLSYMLLAARRNRWLHVVAAGAIGMGAQYAWTISLNAANVWMTGRWAWINVQGIEQVQLMHSLGEWMMLLPSPTAFARRLAGGVVEFSAFECPLLIAAALLCWLVQRRTKAERWFDVVVVVPAFAAGFVYLNHLGTRGYLVYGTTLVFYATLAGSLALWLRESRVWRWVGVSSVVTLLAVQIVWSTAYLWGYLLPMKLFFGFGYLDWIPRAITSASFPPALSLTGAEATPVMFGGHATLKDAGLFILSSVSVPKYSLPFGLFIRAPLVACLCLLAVASGFPRRLQTLFATGALVWLGPVLIAQAAPVEPEPIFSTFDAIDVAPGQTLRYSVDLGDAFVTAFDRQAPTAQAVRFMVWGLQPPFETRVLDGEGGLIALGTDGSMFVASDSKPHELSSILSRSRRLTVEIAVAPEGHTTTVLGWQRAGLPGRTAVTLPNGAAWHRPVLPAVEVWLFDGRHRPLLVGF